jgi:hypothetical protein
LDADGACDSASDGSEVKLAPFFAQKKPRKHGFWGFSNNGGEIGI